MYCNIDIYILISMFSDIVIYIFIIYYVLYILILRVFIVIIKYCILFV